MVFDNGDDNMTMVAITLVVVAVMFCKVTVYSTTAVIVICRVEKTWSDQIPLQPIRSQHVGDCAELHWTIFLSWVYLYEPCLCSSPRLHPSSRTIFSTSGTWHHFDKLVRPSAIFAHVQSDAPNIRLYNCIQLCVPRCEISALILFFVLFQQSRMGTFQSWRCMTFHGIFESNRFQSPGSLHFHGGLGQWVAVSFSAAARAIAAVPLIPKRFVTGCKCLWQTCNILWDFLQDLQIGSQIQKLDLDLHYVVTWSEEVSLHGLWQGLLLIFLMTCALLILLTVAVSTFQSEAWRVIMSFHFIAAVHIEISRLLHQHMKYRLYHHYQL